MGLFNKNNKDDEYLTVLGEIRDNLKYGIKEDRFDEVIRNLETRIVEFKHNNDTEIEDLTVKVNELAKVTDLQAKQLDENYTLLKQQEEDINKLTDIVKKQNNILRDFNKRDTDAPKITKNDEVIYAYGRNWKSYHQINLNNIVKLDEKGNFIRIGRGKQSFTWNINTLLKLREYMKEYDKYPSQKKLAKAIGVNPTSLIELGYYILNGDFDKYFNEWEQIQADNTFKKYGNWKPTIENNPEKRKEKGYV